MREFTVNKNDAGQRMDKFLTKAVPALPKSLMYKYIRLKRIKLNGKRCEISTRLAEDDSVQLYINDEFFPEKRDAAHRFLNAPSELSIVYEDENILLCDKPCGLVVHEDESGGEDTLIDRVLHYLYDKGEYDPDSELSFTPALCNRIDRNTQGIVICAKNAESLRILNSKVKDREIEKTYLCVTVGIPRERSAELKAYHRRSEQTKTVKVSDKPFEGCKTMITRYKVIAENRQEGLALLEVGLVTGRTHQIRAHMAHIGCPLLGDGKYGSNKVNRQFGVKTQALCAWRLTFRFTSDSGCLGYLDGKSFESGRVWFKDRFTELKKTSAKQ